MHDIMMLFAGHLLHDGPLRTEPQRSAAIPPALIESDNSSRFSVITAYVFLCHYCEECQTKLGSTCVSECYVLHPVNGKK